MQTRTAIRKIENRKNAVMADQRNTPQVKETEMAAESTSEKPVAHTQGGAENTVTHF